MKTPRGQSSAEGFFSELNPPSTCISFPTIYLASYLMTVTQLSDFPLAELIPHLTAKGWDITLADSLTGFRQDAHGAFRLTVDRSGRAYLRRTWIRASGPGKTIHREGHTFAIHVEEHQLHEVMTILDSVEAFPRVLSIMCELTRSPEVMD